MGDFIKAVRNGNVRQPTQNKFCDDLWARAYEESSSDPEDQHLFEVGLWIYKRLEKIRSALSEGMALPLMNKRQRVLLFCGAVNFQVVGIAAMRPNIPKECGLIDSRQMLQAKMSLNFGPDASPDDVLCVLIDGARLPLRFDVLREPRSVGNSSETLSEKNVVGLVGSRCLTGQLYDQLETLWMVALWRGLKIKKHKEFDEILPCDDEYEVNHAISLFRRESIQHQATSLSYGLWGKLPDQTKRILNYWPEVVVSKKKKSTCFTVRFPSTISQHPSTFAVYRMSIEQLYFSGLCNIELPNCLSVTINQLLRVWAALFSLTKYYAEKLEVPPEITEVREAMRYAPEFQKYQLLNIISEAAGVDNRAAEVVLNFLTFEDTPQCDLWTHPFITVDTNRLTMLLAPPRYGNPLRCIEQWMVQGGLDLSKRGPLFEQQLQQSLSDSMSRSRHLSSGGVLDRALKLEANSQIEEIDIVMWFGNLIILGEAKCVLFPAEPLEYHKYRQRVEEASDQIRRKAKFATHNLPRLLSSLGLENKVHAEKVRVVPVVILNQPYGVGFPVNDIPVVDELILCGFLRGEMDDIAIIGADGVKPLRTVQFYNSEDDASEKLQRYLFSPPQIERHRELVKDQHMPICSMGDLLRGGLRTYKAVVSPVEGIKFE